MQLFSVGSCNFIPKPVSPIKQRSHLTNMDYVEMENNQLKQCGVHTGHVAAPGGQCVFRALPALARERGSGSAD